ncbi:hypothetical protein PLCT2_02959 [Planctomycetaceae bacterium]|nr:hypothetical protein PLCT2_02959 [Planctomycetaceae bacterium]
MAKSNRERVSEGLDILRDALRPFVESRLIEVLGPKWLDQVNAGRQVPLKRAGDVGAQWDAAALLNTINAQWTIFSKTLDKGHRAYVNEILDIRNKAAHPTLDESFSYDQTYRALDTMKLLLFAVSAGDAAARVEKLAEEAMRVKFTEQRRTITRQIKKLEVNVKEGLKPWREIITPHKDVAEGRYQQAEFAADLAQVHRGDAVDEYGKPVEFYRRTFITQGLAALLKNALVRLNGKGGDPVVKLQTNFGGGKTHSMLALYHLCGGSKAQDLPGLDDLLRTVKESSKIDGVKECARAVVVGTDFSPSKVHKKPDGVEVNTLWGEIAWQLGNSAGKKKGKEAYKLIEEDDKARTSPESGDLAKLFNQYGPCLILIDEWVAFLRNIGEDSKSGTIDANFTFVQALTEAMKSAKNSLLVVSLPESNLEVGGDRGRTALSRLEQTVGRVETAWRPASAEEGFEIVRRRLFKPIEPEMYASRDAVVKSFSDLYQKEKKQFPAHSGEEEYRRRMEAAYPFHPELFARLYKEWSTLDRFQRTRGVLRLMAAVVHTLWDAGDKELMIMPCSIPLDDDKVRGELQSYLEEQWEAVFDTDIDGETSAARVTDNANERLGKYSACRRVARTLFMATAPTHKTAAPGIDAEHVRLGCVQPGELPDVFSDAMRRMAEQAGRYIYSAESRYWFAPQPTVARLADDRAAQQKPDDIKAHINTCVDEAANQRKRGGPFAAVQAVPSGHGEVPDEREARLVVLGAEYPHTKGAKDSPAMAQAREILAHRGNSPRYEKNMIVFLAADTKSLPEMETAVRAHLAWKSIMRDENKLNLTSQAKNQAEDKIKDTGKTIGLRLAQTWVWPLVPTQPAATGPVEISEQQRLKGASSFVDELGSKLEDAEMLFTTLGPKRLKMVLDEFLWKDADHLGIKRLWEEYLTRYVYLPRLRDQNVLMEAIRSGLAGSGLFCDFFGYAEGYDAKAGRYLGLKISGGAMPQWHQDALLVKPDIANRQIELDRKAQQAGGSPVQAGRLGLPAGQPGSGGTQSGKPVAPKLPTQFFGTVELSPDRVGSQAGKVAMEVLLHLMNQPDSKVKVTLDIEATLPKGADEAIQRTVLENCAALKFVNREFTG